MLEFYQVISDHLKKRVHWQSSPKRTLTYAEIAHAVKDLVCASCARRLLFELALRSC